MNDPGNSSDEEWSTQKTTPDYQLLSLETAEATAELYTGVSLNDEPMTRHHRIDPFAFLPSAREYLRYCAGQQLSFIAVDEETREVMEFVLGSDLSTDWESVGPGVRTLLSFFFGRAWPSSTNWSTAAPISGMSVREQSSLSSRQESCEPAGGRASLPVSSPESLTTAKKRGFGKVIAECTGPVSRHTCEKCGFHAEAFVAYDEFQVDGRVFFQGLPGGISLMIRDV
jgi:hypothetical protein